ncbi:hypothetical protein B0T26DRAFT_782795, partial [Lasiosphaeria miniovina]
TPVNTTPVNTTSVNTTPVNTTPAPALRQIPSPSSGYHHQSLPTATMSRYSSFSGRSRSGSGEDVYEFTRPWDRRRHHDFSRPPPSSRHGSLPDYPSRPKPRYRPVSLYGSLPEYGPRLREFQSLWDRFGRGPASRAASEVGTSLDSGHRVSLSGRSTSLDRRPGRYYSAFHSATPSPASSNDGRATLFPFEIAGRGRELRERRETSEERQNR